MKLKIIPAFLFLLVFSTVAFSQSVVTIAAHQADYKEMFDDSLAASLTKLMAPSSTHSGWYRSDIFQYFSTFFDFDTTGFAAGIGLTSADTVKIWMEQYSGETTPTLSTEGFYSYQAPGTAITRTLVASFDSTSIIDNPRIFRSFHNSGSPDIAPSQYIRFYSQVVGGFTSGGLGLTFGVTGQP